MGCKLYIANVSSLYDDTIYNQLYCNLSSDRRDKTDLLKLKKDKILSIASETLLRYAIKDYLGKDIELNYIYLKNNKPYLKDEKLYFNISHSKEYCIVALSDSEIGCDIEYIDDIDLNIAKRFFTKNEYNNIVNNIDSKNMFYRYWTLKESFVKVTGMGLKLPLDSFEVQINSNIDLIQNFDNNEYYFKEIDVLKDYRISICNMSKLDDLEIEIVKI